MVVDPRLVGVIDALKEMREDSTTPRSLKAKIGTMLQVLQSEQDIGMKIDTLMHVFEALNDDSNIDSYTRTQLWNITSMLESL